jgi:hypothetical protein
LEEMDGLNSALLSSAGENYDVLVKDMVAMQIEVSKMNSKLTSLKYEQNNVHIKIDEKDDSIKKSKLNQCVVKFENKFVLTEKPEVLKFKFLPYFRYFNNF